MDNYVIRDATEADLPVINDIYNYYVLNSTCTFQITPENMEGREAWFSMHGPKHPVIVAEIGGEVVGWASLSVFIPREGYSHTVDDSVYIRADMHRKGIGRALLGECIERARKIGHHTIMAGICSEQTASLGLHASMGFTQAAHMKELGSKFDRWLDVILMQLML